jgi:hypothetical protein
VNYRLEDFRREYYTPDAIKAAERHQAARQNDEDSLAYRIEYAETQMAALVDQRSDLRADRSTLTAIIGQIKAQACPTCAAGCWKLDHDLSVAVTDDTNPCGTCGDCKP